MQDRIPEEQAAIREAQEFISRQEQEIRNQIARDAAGNIDETQSANNLRNKINEVEGSARSAQIRIESGEQIEGVSFANQAGTTRNNLEITRIATKEVLRLYKQNPNFYNRILPVDSIGKRVLDQLINRIDDPNAEIRLESSPYIQKIIRGAINNTINNPLEALSDNEMAILNASDSILHRKVVEALVVTARQVGRTEEEIREFENHEMGRREEVRRRLDEERRRQREGGTYAGVEMIKKLAPEHPRLSSLYEALTSVDSFIGYYRERVNALRDEQNPQKATSEEIITDLIHIVNIIYRPVLRSAPEEPFEKLEQEAGEFGSTPNFVFQHIAQTMLGNLQAHATSVREKGEGSDLTFYAYNRTREETYLEGSRQTVLVVTPGAQLEEIERDKGLEEFVEFLKEAVNSERESLRYGFNFTFLLKKGPPGGKDEFWFKQLAEYAANLKSHHLDMSRALPYANEIQAMEMIISDMYRKEFGYLGRWEKKVGLMEEFFSRFSIVEKKVMELMRRRKIDGRDIPEWVVERSLHQARMKFFGIDFMLNSMAGFMDPDYLEKATATYISEGDYYGLFDIWSLGKRFRTKDPTLAGLMYMPVDQRQEWFDHTVTIEKGKKIWEEMFKLGQSAKIGSRIFEGNLREDEAYTGVLLQGEISNITESGGVDTLDSWRNLYQYLQWLQLKGDQEVTPETKEINFAKPMVLVNSWKRIENLGISVLRNFTEQLLIGGGGFDALSDLEVLEVVEPNEVTRYEELFRFFYRRYLNVEDGVGKAFLQKRDGVGNLREISENEYIQNVKDILQATDKENYKIQGRKLKSLVYQALTVAMFERLPLDFILMENKPRITQNGVTMLSEIEHYFKTELQGENRWNTEEFSDALDDLIFVQQEARVKSMEGMEDSLVSYKNLFGRDLEGINMNTLDNYSSTVLNGRDYIIDEEFIIETLPDEARREKAVALYRKIKEIIVLKPSANYLEANNLREYERRKKFYGSRMKWWVDALENKKFGFSVTSAEKAQRFLNYSATGPETTKRAANFCANTAELVYKSFIGEFKLACEKAEADKKYDALVAWLYPIKKGVEYEWGEEIAYKVAKRFEQMIIQMFRRDDRANLPLGTAKDWVFDKVSNIMQEFKGGARRGGWGWWRDEIYGFVTATEEKNILPKYTKPEDRQYREHLSSDQLGVFTGLARALNGGRPTLYNVDDLVNKKYIPGFMKKWIKNLARDYGNEFSGEGVRGQNKSGWPDVFKTKFIGLFLLLLFLIAKSAYDKEKKKE